jgi:hypothetical protein
MSCQPHYKEIIIDSETSNLIHAVHGGLLRASRFSCIMGFVSAVLADGNRPRVQAITTSCTGCSHVA